MNSNGHCVRLESRPRAPKTKFMMKSSPVPVVVPWTIASMVCYMVSRAEADTVAQDSDHPLRRTGPLTGDEPKGDIKQVWKIGHFETLEDSHYRHAPWKIRDLILISLQERISLTDLLLPLDTAWSLNQPRDRRALGTARTGHSRGSRRPLHQSPTRVILRFLREPGPLLDIVTLFLNPHPDLIFPTSPSFSTASFLPPPPPLFPSLVTSYSRTVLLISLPSLSDHLNHRHNGTTVYAGTLLLNLLAFLRFRYIPGTPPLCRMTTIDHPSHLPPIYRSALRSQLLGIPSASPRSRGNPESLVR
ncbi:hypothetical protein PDE_02580 [Penicillium oxalicum 114-2]|uniref:Uncharacterized protein n=1 Tax=Penicillium oxalicum (strain 114-2 / CGMCC 5302) TaxID=933388 RepID=S7ZG56_PENO1|nr:hypothetical protein PDE_02580 [Penicillium oxalicum 114-2]